MLSHMSLLSGTRPPMRWRTPRAEGRARLACGGAKPGRGSRARTPPSWIVRETPSATASPRWSIARFSDRHRSATGAETPGGQRGAESSLASLRNVERCGGWLRLCRGSLRSVVRSPRRDSPKRWLKQQRGCSAACPPAGWMGRYLAQVSAGHSYPNTLRRVARPRRKLRPTGAPARQVTTVVDIRNHAHGTIGATNGRRIPSIPQ